MDSINWSNPIVLTIIGILVLMIIASFIDFFPAIIRGILRVVVALVVIIYILQYIGLIAPVFPPLRNIGEKTVEVTKEIADESKGAVKNTKGSNILEQLSEVIPTP